jgi:IclR family acetate operon transcriptional repressor
MVVRDAPAKSRGGTLRSVARAFTLLDALAAHPEGATPKALSADLGIHLSTVYHLLATLRDAGYVVQDPESRLFHLGPRVPWLNDAFLASLQIAPWALPFLHTLSQATGETAILCRWWGEGVIIAAIAEGTSAGHFSGAFVGSVTLPHLTAAGCVLLAWASERRLNVLFARPDLVGDDRVNVLEELRRIRATSHAIDRGRDPRFCCVAAPVIGAGGRVEESLAVMLPFPHFAQAEDAVVRAVVGIAQAASAVAAAPADWSSHVPGEPGTRREDLAAVFDAGVRMVTGLPLAADVDGDRDALGLSRLV